MCAHFARTQWKRRPLVRVLRLFPSGSSIQQGIRPAEKSIQRTITRAKRVFPFSFSSRNFAQRRAIDRKTTIWKTRVSNALISLLDYGAITTPGEGERARGVCQNGESCNNVSSGMLNRVVTSDCDIPRDPRDERYPRIVP